MGQWAQFSFQVKGEAKSLCKQTLCLHFELLDFLKYDELFAYNTHWFAKLLNEYELKSRFRKIRNI